MPDVLAWLQAQHPQLHGDAVIDRSWLWLAGDRLKPCQRGCDCEACKAKAIIRQAISEYGFRFAKRGHELPDGKLAWWGHSCERPTRFHKGQGRAQGAAPSTLPVSNANEDFAALLAGI